MLLLVLLGCPLAAALLIAVLPAKSTPRGAYETLHVLSLAGVAVAGLTLVVAAFAGSDIFALGEWFHLDGLSALFLGLIAVIAPCTGVYSLPYVAHDVAEGKLGPSQVKQYYAFFSLFVFSMILAVTSNNIIMMWVSVEATTLSTVFLVGVYRTKLALEGGLEVRHRLHGWRGLRLVRDAARLCERRRHYGRSAPGGVLDSHPSQRAVHGPVPHDDRVRIRGHRFWNQGGPVPHAHVAPRCPLRGAEPVSALLSGVLLKCAILIVLRFYILTAANVGATFPQTVMMILGVLSVCYAAFEVYKQNDLKRKLAYSSCENVGLIAVCFGIGRPPRHHRPGSCTALPTASPRPSCSALSGNVMMKYHTRDLAKISGIISVAPVTGVLFAAGCLALAGFPPFAMFVSEMFMVLAGVAAEVWWAVALVLVALVVVIMALVRMITGSALGRVPRA